MEKWSCRNPLKLEDRQKIQEGLQLGLSSREIARMIHREKTVILRESMRLGDREKYDAILAQIHFETTQRKGWEKCKETKRKKKKVA